jgi:phosphoglycolate phosphatase-like HAD superfamily hydrolase
VRVVTAILLAVLIGMTGCGSNNAGNGADPLSGWSDMPAKKSITEFVDRVTTANTPDFVAEDDRIALSHLGMTTDEFDTRVSDWLATTRHPRFNRPYDQLTYEPQQQLLNYLRANGFRTYIVSGGGTDFMRVFAERVYRIPPEQVVGST